MTTHARTPHNGAASRRLTSSEVVDVLRVAVQECGRPGAPAHLPAVLESAVGRLGRPALSEAEIWQIADAVVSANRLPAAAGAYDLLEAVDSTVRASPDASTALHALLVEAWITYEPGERTGRGMATGSTEDQESEDLRKLTLCGRYFLLAHDPHSGETLVPEGACALGLAGALLGECVLTGIVRLDRASGMLAAHATPAAQPRMSQVAEDIARRLREPRPLRTALDEVRADAYTRVRGELLYSGVLAPRESHRRLRGPRTVFAPVRPRVTERVFNAVVLLKTGDASHLDLQDAVLIALVRATGLASAAGRQWWMAEGVPAEQALTRHPGLAYLIGQVSAAVTTSIAARQR